MAKIIDGRTHAAAITDEVRTAVTNGGLCLKLAVVQVGCDAASTVYINMKKRACEAAGIGFTHVALPENATQVDILSLLHDLNRDPATTGILVQKPLPPHLSDADIVAAIAPEKDVDCLHPANVGRLVAGTGKLLPCTPAGVIQLLHRENIPIAGKHAVIVGRSDIVGKPLAFLLLQENATVTICHSRTADLPAMCRTADILVAAIGRPRFFTAQYIKPAAAVIDVGVNRLHGKKICGDVAEEAAATAGYITPVPGGVGPMTVAMLLRNVLHAGTHNA
jgi:methylenetetrahydrofolate dehydrogenase (NADP+)/methenyltetrahydrofolate cyclohydrolase